MAGWRVAKLSCSLLGMCLCSGYASLVSSTTKCTHVPSRVHSTRNSRCTYWSRDQSVFAALVCWENVSLKSFFYSNEFGSFLNSYGQLKYFYSTSSFYTHYDEKFRIRGGCDSSPSGSSWATCNLCWRLSDPTGGVRPHHLVWLVTTICSAPNCFTMFAWALVRRSSSCFWLTSVYLRSDLCFWATLSPRANKKY